MKNIFNLLLLFLAIQFNAQTNEALMRGGSCGTSSNICVEPTSYNYKSVRDGSWSSSSTWQGGNIPPSNVGSGKKVLITHHVTRSGDFKPSSNSFLVITNGGIFTTGQIQTDNSNATIIIKNGKINVTNGNFQITTSSSSVCAINSCIYVKNGDFQFEKEGTEMNFDNTGIHLVNGNLQSKAKVTGSGIKVKLQNGNFERNGGTWSGSTVAAWYASGSVKGFSGLPRESSSSLDVCAGTGISIDAVNDALTLSSGNSGTVSVLNNDTVNGATATLTNVNLTQVSTSNPNVMLNTATGNVSVAAGTPAGTYNLVYQICAKSSPSVCDTATVIVTVNTTIDAVNDAQTLSAGSTGTVSVLNNDTLNGAGATLTNVNLTQVSTSNPNVTLNTATGNISVAAGTPAGTYNVVYQICDKLNPTACDTATVTVTVNSTIDAVNDAETISAGSLGTVSVLNNDTLNGAGATLTNVNLTQVSTTNPGVTLNTATGNISVASGTPAGTYDVVYQICDKVSASVCDTATVTVTVPVTQNVDLALEISASQPIIITSDDNSIFYSVSNVGTTSTNGATITINASSPTVNGGLFSSSTPLPTGWSLVSHTGNTFVFTTNKVIAPGASDTFVFNYYVETTISPSVIFVGNVATTGESNTSNNDDSMVLQVRNP